MSVPVFLKKGCRCSFTSSQKFWSLKPSPPILSIPALTAAPAPESLITSFSPSKQLPDNGTGSPAISFILTIASFSLVTKQTLFSTSGLGSTFTDAESIKPKVPLEPVSTRETSKPATFFMTFPPKLKSFPLPSRIRTPNTKSRTAPIVARLGPDKPVAIQPPNVAFSPK